MSNSLIAWIDGSSRGNPGPAGLGVFIQDSEGKTLDEISEYLGDKITNNRAEYSALIRALEACRDLGAGEVKILSDSQLLIRQMKGRYDVNSKNLKDLYRRAKRLESEFQRVTYEHIGRGENEIADGLANRALDEEDV